MKKTILLVAGILIVAGIVVGGAWYWQGKMQANKNDFVTNVPNSNPIPAIPQNPATKPVTQLVKRLQLLL